MGSTDGTKGRGTGHGHVLSYIHLFRDVSYKLLGSPMPLWKAIPR
ncbi:protein of unknown function [Pseudomonas sp. JV551A1]|nr:protein of unknown function [Pseudomonas sp. JV551A1]